MRNGTVGAAKPALSRVTLVLSSTVVILALMAPAAGAAQHTAGSRPSTRSTASSGARARVAKPKALTGQHLITTSTGHLVSPLHEHVKSAAVPRGQGTGSAGSGHSSARDHGAPARTAPPDLRLAKGLAPRWMLNQAPQRWMTVSGRPTPASVRSAEKASERVAAGSAAAALKAAKQHKRQKPAATSAGAAQATSSTSRALGLQPRMSGGSTGSVAGVVTDAVSSQPIASVVVTAYSRTTYTTAPESAVTSPTGSYTLTGLPADSYDIVFTDNSQGHLVQYSGEQPTSSTATPVIVTAGTTTSAVNAELIPGGSISGVITSSATGLPIANVCASVFTPSGIVAAGGCSDATGAYQTTGLPAGRYEVEFYDNNNVYLSGWHGGSSLTTATPVTVTKGAVTSGIGIALVRGGDITGTVADSTTSAPLASVCGYAYGNAGYSASFCSNAAGTFDITGVATGSYSLYFYDQELRYLPTGYVGPGGVTTVAVTTGATTSGLRVAMQLGGSVSGTVTDASTGLPLVGMCSTTYYGYTPTTTECSSATGAFTVTGIASGSYYLYLTDPAGRYLPYDAPTPVTVTAPGSVGGVTATMTLGGSISGVVDDSVTHVSVSGVCVTVYTGSYGYYDGSACTDGSGAYQVNGLGTGSYTVYFYDNLGRYIETSYGEVGTSGTPTPVSVTVGVTTPSIDAQLIKGTISGTITDSVSHHPLAGICVTAYGDESVTSCSRANGTYSVFA